MRQTCLAVFICFFSLHLEAKESVAVIGAGAAGIAAADFLKQNGYRVEVFEKNNRVGGKCHTMRASQGYGVVELGAIQVGPAYNIVMEYAKELGHSLRQYWQPNILRPHPDGGAEIKRLGSHYTPYMRTPALIRESHILSAALERYREIDEEQLSNIPLTSEFNMPFEEWADELGLKHFKEIFRIWITSYGYGNLKQIPAYLPLNLIGASYGLALMTRLNMNLRMLSKGYEALIEGIVETHQLDVKLGVNISRITRNNDEVKIFYEKEGTSYEKAFDRLVLACGFECINEIIAQPTAEETALINELYFTPYDVVIARVEGLQKGGYVLTENLHQSNHVTLISKNSAGSEDTILYVPRGQLRKAGQKPIRPTKEELEQTVRDDMAALGFNQTQILHVQFWDNYFPHFRNPYAYNLLSQIQGENRTLYVGSFGRFEIVEKAMSHAVDTISKHLIFETNHFSSKVNGFTRLKNLYNWYKKAEPRDGGDTLTTLETNDSSSF